MQRPLAGIRLIGIFLVVLVTVACPVLAKELRVVTTFSILEDFVQQIGGERVEVNSLIPRGADPHTWEASPKEARLVAQADLLVANGGGFDDWLLSLVENAAKADTPVILVSQGLPILEHNHGQHGHGGDPHFWLSVPNAIFYAEQIMQALVDLLPIEAPYFQERGNTYIQELVELDQQMVDELGRIPEENRVIVTYHNAFSYLAERYGFEVVEFLVDNPEAEPSPRDLGRLVALLKGQETPVLFAEPQLGSGTRYMQTLAREIRGEIYTLYSDTLTSEVPTYVEMMRYNMKTLAEALK